MAKNEGYSTTPKPTDPIPGVGPTIEEFVRAGYDPAHYPTEGYAEVPSEGLERYKRGENVFPDGYSTVASTGPTPVESMGATNPHPEPPSEPEAETDQAEDGPEEPTKKKGGKKK